MMHQRASGRTKEDRHIVGWHASSLGNNRNKFRLLGGESIGGDASNNEVHC